MAKKKEEVVIEDTTTNLLSSLLNGYKEDHYNFIESKPFTISTGSLKLDKTIGKIQSGSVVRLAGPFGAGKTSQALLLAYNFFQTRPKSKGIYVKAEARLREELQQRSGIKYVFTPEEWVEGTMFVLESNVFEAIADMFEAMLKACFEQGIELVMIIDSLDALILRNDLKEKKIGDNTMVAGVPKMTKLFFRRLGLPINKYNALVILTSQASANIQLNPYSKEPPRPVAGAGGAAAAHAVDVLLEYQPRYPGHNICEDEDEKPSDKNPIIGWECHIQIVKAPTENRGEKIIIPIRKGQKTNSIWRNREVAELLLSMDIAHKEGQFIRFGENTVKEAKAAGVELKEEVRGLKAYMKYIEESQDVADYFASKLDNFDTGL
jgi:RecA/RadA recombinase